MSQTVFEILQFFDVQNGFHLHLGFLKCQNFISWWVHRAEMHHHPKFWQNWSGRCIISYSVLCVYWWCDTVTAVFWAWVLSQ